MKVIALKKQEDTRCTTIYKAPDLLREYRSRQVKPDICSIQYIFPPLKKIINKCNNQLTYIISSQHTLAAMLGLEESVHLVVAVWRMIPIHWSKASFGTTGCFQKGEPGAEWKRFVALWLLLTENHKGTGRSKQPETVLEHFAAFPVWMLYIYFNFAGVKIWKKKYHFCMNWQRSRAGAGAGWGLATPRIVAKNLNRVKYRDENLSIHGCLGCYNTRTPWWWWSRWPSGEVGGWAVELWLAEVKWKRLLWFQEAGRNCLDKDTADLNLWDSTGRRHQSVLPCFVFFFTFFISWISLCRRRRRRRNAEMFREEVTCGVNADEGRGEGGRRSSLRTGKPGLRWRRGALQRGCRDQENKKSIYKQASEIQATTRLQHLKNTFHFVCTWWVFFFEFFESCLQEQPL